MTDAAPRALHSSTPASPAIWRCGLHLLGLHAPLLAAAWMAIFTRTSHITLRLDWVHGRHWWAQLGALTLTAWAMALGDRVLAAFHKPQPENTLACPGGSPWHFFFWRNRREAVVLLAAAACAGAVSLALCQISTTVVFGALPLLGGAALCQSLRLIGAQRSNGRGATFLFSGFLAALAVFALRTPDLTPAGTLSRLWIVLGGAAGLLLAFDLTESERPRLEIVRRFLCAYIFAAGCALVPAVRTGDFQAALTGELVLLLAGVFALRGVVLAARESAFRSSTETLAAGSELTTSDRAESALLRRLAPVGILACAAAAALRLGGADPADKPFALACLIVVAALACLHFLGRRFSFPAFLLLADAAALAPLAVLPWFDRIAAAG